MEIFLLLCVIFAIVVLAIGINGRQNELNEKLNSLILQGKLPPSIKNNYDELPDTINPYTIPPKVSRPVFNPKPKIGWEDQMHASIAKGETKVHLVPSGLYKRNEDGGYDLTR